MKKRLQALLLAAVMLLSMAAFSAPAAAESTLTVSQVSGAKGEEVDVEIRLNSDEVSGGNFTVRYDSDVLELVNTTPLFGGSCMVNPVGKGTVKVIFAQTAAVAGDTAICALTFRITGATDAQDGTPIVLEQVKLYRTDSGTVSASVIHGAVTRRTVRLRMSASETAEYQAVRAIVQLEGGLSPAGGNFSIQYDPAHFSVRSVLPLEAADGAGFSYNIVQPGLVTVSFSAAKALKKGQLFAVVFQTVGSAGASSALTISDVSMYDEDSELLDVSVVNGSLRIVVPSDDDPKLWVIGGAMQAEDKARVAVVLQGRGYVCGGNFRLCYDKRMTATVTPSASCQISHDATRGEILVSWAADTPYSGEAQLLTVEFSGAVESAVTLDSALFYDKEATSISPVDIRPGAISAADTVKAVVEQEDVAVKTVGSQTTLTVPVDIADMSAFSAQPQGAVSAALALYQDGKMVGLAAAPVTFSGGVQELELEAKTNQTVTDYQVFLLDGTSPAPLCQSLSGSAPTN